MHRVLDSWAQTFYTRPALVLILIIALFISIKNRKKYTLLKFFPIYIASLITDYLSADLYFVLFSLESRKKVIRFDRFTDYFFTLIELLIFANFFIKLIQNSTRKNIIKIVTALFFLFFIYRIMTDSAVFRTISYKTLNTIYTIEAVILIFFCLLYFYELFKQLPTLNLLNEPSFWISTGLFFFMSCTLPYSLLENYLRKNYFDLEVEFYSIFYMFYSLMFIMIIKAYLCRPAKTI
jgi:hypothetical protein